MATWKRGWSTILLDWRPSRAVTWAGMSRHQMIVIVAMGRSDPSDGQRGGHGRRRPAGDDRIDGRGEVAEPGEPALVREPQASGGPARDPVEGRVLGLGEVD